MTTLQTISKLLADYKKIDGSSITAETTFESLGIDSLDTVELVMDLEEAFSIIIEREEGLKTVGELAAIIDELLVSEGSV